MKREVNGILLCENMHNLLLFYTVGQIVDGVFFLSTTHDNYIRW